MSVRRRIAGRGGRSGPPRLVRWRTRPVIAVSLVALASGFGQFGAVAALGDVARSFGQLTHGTTIADQAGLSGTVLGVGLAVLRLASIAGLPAAGVADRIGRRPVLFLTVGVGLVLTMLAALSPNYWWFVAIFACGRPLLSATNAVAQVSAAELTDSGERAKAVALVTAGYAVGAGITALAHSLGLGGSNFRILFALAVLPLAMVALIRRWVVEPDRFAVSSARPERPLPVIGAIGRPYRRRLGVVLVLAFAISVISGPANSFVFLYAENVVRQSGTTTAVMVVLAGAAGLGGLLLGRWLADHFGRRPTVVLAVAAAAVFGVTAYSGGRAMLFVGYVGGIVSGSLLAPALGSLVNELFPTEVRASAAGWWVAAGVVGAVIGLVLFGTLADVDNRFSFAGIMTFLPAAALSALVWLVPETAGKEPEELTRGLRGEPV